MIVWGEEDRIIPVAHAYETHEAVPGSRLEVLPGAGHFLPFEEPAWFTEVLVDFLRTTEPAHVDADFFRQTLLERSSR